MANTVDRSGLPLAFSNGPDRPRGRWFGAALLLLSALGLATLLLVLEREAARRRIYGAHQQRYARLAAAAGRRAMREGDEPVVQRLEIGDEEYLCLSCHAGLLEPPLSGKVKNPYRAHPAAVLKNHPPRRFGCTCHGEGGRRLDRCLPAQRDPGARSLDRAHARASCGRCHGWTPGLAGADLLTRGLRAYARLGCGGCHRTSELQVPPRKAPPLDRLWTKLQPEFVRSFLADSSTGRGASAMPLFFSDLAVDNAPPFTRDRVRTLRAGQIRSLVAFLLSPGPGRGGEKAPPRSRAGGDPAAGARLFEELACKACHNPFVVERVSPLVQGIVPQGSAAPDLGGAGLRLVPGWVQTWLRSPGALYPQTRMPRFDLSPTQLADLAAHLESRADRGSPDPPWRSRPIVLPAPALMVETGKDLARSLGCGGCHEMEALKGAPLAGPDLDGFGDRTFEELDWGLHEQPPERRSFWTWTTIKLQYPLTFDRRPGVLAMPSQQPFIGGADDAHVDNLHGLVLLLRSLTLPGPGAAAAPVRAPLKERRLRAGEEIVEELSCRQCHRIRGRGGRARALPPGPEDRPPALLGEGAKVQPAWLHAFLRRPGVLRPWLKVRMPAFERLDSRSADQLVAFLAAADGASYPFVDQTLSALEARPERLRRSLVLFEKLKCLSCHQLANAPRLKPGELAPDMALAATRLRRSWVRRFILKPQQLMPGTRMPALFPLIDEDDPGAGRVTPQPGLMGGNVEQQVEALTDLTMWWGSSRGTAFRAAGGRVRGGVP